MVDELMLRDVKNILKKLEVIRAREDIEQILLDSGLNSDSSIDEINELLVAKFMTQEELVLYKKYVLYKRREDLKNLVGTIDSLEQLTLSVGVLYENIQSTKSTISSINGIVDRVDNGLRGYPNIRVSTAYNRVKVDYRRYFDAYIKDGMDRAVFTEEIDRINHSSAIVRGLKKRRLKQLREGLREHNKNSKKHVNDLYEDYIGSRDEYGSYLREVMTKLLSKNDTLYEAGLLSLASMYGELIPVKTLGTGVKTVDRSVEIEIKPEYIASKAFEYFQKLDEPEFDEKVFIKAFREFLLHFYNAELERLHKSIVLDNKAIRNAFTKQREVMGSIASYQESIVVPDVSLDKDTEDTMALVYRNN